VLSAACACRVGPRFDSVMPMLVVWP
jgi:hypothetical protein